MTGTSERQKPEKTTIELLVEGYSILRDKGEDRFRDFIQKEKISSNDEEAIRLKLKTSSEVSE